MSLVGLVRVWIEGWSEIGDFRKHVKIYDMKVLDEEAEVVGSFKVHVSGTISELSGMVVWSYPW